MLFRSTCSWPFSVENPLRVATEALNIHLVSCILYFLIPTGLFQGHHTYNEILNKIFIGSAKKAATANKAAAVNKAGGIIYTYLYIYFGASVC